MSWTCAPLLALLTVLLALSLSPEVDSAAMPGTAGSARDPPGPLGRVFMKEADAADFFRRRSRRSMKSQDEINTEQRLASAADERKREFHEEKRNEFESYAEEEHDEQNERSRESTEQWREFHYDGMHPPHEYNRHSV
ncbi:unique cartilage matrix-associated protein [Betta splendens]|uniref:Unique cartilage matrix-associated protein n=1 Tax=Betta splendens TaxID=158456 RepID=A0A6P7MTT7_BETSP|nr:unique cartilage matrix-associated protein [Betta splendens]XP_055365467.1 unique cartilage matrix-associated protein [Betta splendens]